MSQGDIEFAELVHLSVVVNKDKKKNLETVAQSLGMSYDTLYSRLRSDKTTKFSAGQVKGLIKATEDIRLVDFFLEGTPFIAAEKSKPSPSASSGESLRHNAARTAIETGHIMEQVEQALADGKLCHQDKAKIEKEISDMERVLTSLRSIIRE